MANYRFSTAIPGAGLYRSGFGGPTFFIGKGTQFTASPLATAGQPLISREGRSAGQYHFQGGARSGSIIGFDMKLSANLRRLMQFTNVRQGAIAGINRANGHFLYVFEREVYEEYKEQRRSLASGRDARRSQRLLEQHINPDTALDRKLIGRVVSGKGFDLNYENLDLVVTNKGFPYWRSVEYGYGAFVMYGMFTTNRDFPAGGKKGTFSRPSRGRLGQDPRFPQFSGGAEVVNRGFEGYGFIDKGIRRGARIMRRDYNDVAVQELPPILSEAVYTMGKEGLGMTGGKRPSPYRISGGQRVKYSVFD